MTVVVNDPGNTTGYAITCPACGNQDAHSLPTVVHEPGDVTRTLTYTHVIHCPSCDNLDTPTHG